MTLILDNLKRCEGQTLDDVLADAIEAENDEK